MKPELKDRKLMTTIRDKFDDFWEMDRWFPDDFMRNRMRAMPAVNVMDLEGEYCIEMAAPGLTKEDFKIEIKHGLLTIAAEKKKSSEVNEEFYTRREFNYSAFNRAFSLPENVNPDSVDAKYVGGVLKLHLKKVKPEKLETKRISIK